MNGIACIECGFLVDPALRHCPVCGAEVPHNDDLEHTPPYPAYQLIVKRHRRRLFQNGANLVFMVGVVAVVVVNLLYRDNGWWMWTALPIIAYGWITVSNTMLSNGRLYFRLAVQVYALCALLVFLDWRLGWTGWSTTYALPGVFVVALVGGAAALLVGIGKHWSSLPIGYTVAVAAGAVILPFLGFTNLLTVGWPALSAAILGVALVLAMLLFFRRDLAEHLRSQWHF